MTVPAKVFGRSNEQRRILDSVDSHDIRTVILYGPKYVGKSLLLQNIVQHWEDNHNYSLIYLDLSASEAKSHEEILLQLAMLAVNKLEIAELDQETIAARKKDIAFWQTICDNLPAGQTLLLALDSLQPEYTVRSKDRPDTSQSSSEIDSSSPDTLPIDSDESASSITVSAIDVSKIDIDSPDVDIMPELVPAMNLATTSSANEDNASNNGSLLIDRPNDLPVPQEDEQLSGEENTKSASETNQPSVWESHQALIAFLPKLLECDQIKLVLSADCRESNPVTEYFTGHLHQTRTIQLNPFNREEIEKILSSESMEGIIDWSRRASHERVWEITHGHPAFVSAICSSISDYIFQDIGDLRRAKVITPGMIDSTLPQTFDKVEPMIEWYWASLSKVEQLVLSIIAYVEPNGVSTDGVSLALSDIELTYLGWNRGAQSPLFDVRPSQIDLNTVLRKLRQLNLIELTGQEYNLKVQLIRNWILDNHPLPEDFIGIIQNATKKPIAIKNQGVFGGVLPYSAEQPHRWTFLKIGIPLLAIIAIVGYLTIQIATPDSSPNSITSLIPRIAQTVQSALGIGAPTAETGDENAISSAPAIEEDTTAEAPETAEPLAMTSQASVAESDVDSPAEANETNSGASLETVPTLDSSEMSPAPAETASAAGEPLQESSANSDTSSEQTLQSNDEPTGTDTEQATTGPSRPIVTTIDQEEPFTFYQEIELDEMIWSLAVNRDENLLAVGLENGSIGIWEIDNNEEILEAEKLEGHTQEVLAVAFSPQDSTLLASASADGTIHIWDIETNEVLHNFDQHSDEVYALAFHPDGSMLVSGAADGTVRLWDVENGEPLAALGGENGWVLATAFSTDGALLATGTLDGTIQLWDIEKLTKLDTLDSHKDWVSSVAFSPTTDQLASASYDTSVLLWNREEQSTTLPTGNKEGLPTGVVNSISFHPNGQYLAAAQQDGSILIWNLADPEALHIRLVGHDDAVRSVTFSPLGHYIVTGALDGKVRLWQVNGAE